MRKTAVVLAAVLVGFSLVAADLYKKVNRPGVVFWHGDRGEKKIALTFDDGPNEPYTSRILDVLKENQIKATFFVCGKSALQYPDTLRREYQEGHSIGNHSFDHKDMIFETGKHVGQELTMTDEAIFKAIGLHPTIYRPPFGADDPLTFHESERLGYVAVKWSVSARDWERPGVPKILSNVLNHVQNGAIILMHDGNQCHGGDRTQTVEALKSLIPTLKNLGYEFVTVPELLGLPDKGFKS